MGAAAGHAAHGGRHRHRRHVPSGWPTGEIKACWIICTNPVASVANRRTVIEGLEAAELVITQDVFADTETNAYADVVLPGALWAETEGVMINSERNLTLSQQAVRPARRGAAGLAAHRAGSPARWDTRRRSPTTAPRRSSRRSSAFWNPQTGYDLRGVTYERLRRDAGAVAGRPATARDRNPIRYLNDGVSQSLRRRPTGRAAAGVPDRRAAGPCSSPRPHLPAAETARRRLSRSCSTPGGCSTSGTR